MKSISASIVLLSGSIIFAVGSLVSHDQTQLFLQIVGGAIGLLGLWTWVETIRRPVD